jgi:hypothetical protein
METSKTPTPLLEWLRAASNDQRARAAALAGTSVNYLWQLAGCHRGVPKADLAFMLEDAFRKLHAETDGALPLITARDLSTMCAVAELGAA